MNSLLILLLCVLLGLVVIALYSEVDNSLTSEDLRYIPLYLRDVPHLAPEPTYEEELRYIADVQRALLKVAPHRHNATGIPINQKREPRELYLSNTNLCFDRSRCLEKLLRYSGFETRHVWINFSEGTDSRLKQLLQPKGPSHAASEVLTQRGWLFVTPDSAWLPLKENNDPVSIAQIQMDRDNEAKHCDSISPDPYDQVNVKPFIFIYGLYSRHGRFYPPYNAIPDVNYSELVQNFFGTRAKRHWRQSHA